MEGSCAQALALLEILSLSHNRLTSLEHFENFTNLIEVGLLGHGFLLWLCISITHVCFIYLFTNSSISTLTRSRRSTTSRYNIGA